MNAETCPRCLQHELRVEHEARESGSIVWRIIHCLTCSFSWRTSEPPSAVDPQIRDSDFRVDATRLDRFPIVLAPSKK